MCFKKRKKEKRQIVRFEQNLCNASVTDNEVLFVKVKTEIKTRDDLVEVPMTHYAYVIKGGGNMKFLHSGTHKIFDSAEEYKNFDEIGYSLEVVYMPKEANINIGWGTPHQVRYRDEASKKVINVGANGQFTVSISNPEQFYRKVVAAANEFDKVRFQKYILADVVNEFADMFLQVVHDDGLTYDRLDANRKQIGIRIGEILSEKFNESWGVKLTNFIISSFKISEEDIKMVEGAADEEAQRKRVKEYLAELERLDDKNWEREKYLRKLEMEDRAAYYEVLKAIGHPPVSGATTRGETHCPHCGTKTTNDNVFCPKCGKKISNKKACPSCKYENDNSAIFCVSCGEKL